MSYSLPAITNARLAEDYSGKTYSLSNESALSDGVAEGDHIQTIIVVVVAHS